MRRIELETGDVTNTHERIKFFLEVGHEVLPKVMMGFIPKPHTQFNSDQWQLFLSQMRDAFSPGDVRQTSWWKRGFSSIFGCFGNYRVNNLKNYPMPPLGSEGMKAVINQGVTGTPAYQLFLASIDIAEAFLFEEDQRIYDARLLIEHGLVRSRHGNSSNGVFLLPASPYKLKNSVIWHRSSGLEATLIDEMLNNNLLCKLTIDNSVVRYYIPYATPLSPELSKETQEMWSEIRDYYYHAKHGIVKVVCR